MCFCQTAADLHICIFSGCSETRNPSRLAAVEDGHDDVAAAVVCAWSLDKEKKSKQGTTKWAFAFVFLRNATTKSKGMIDPHDAE